MDWQYWNCFQAFINTVNFMCFELLRIEIIYILERIAPEQYPVRLFVFDVLWFPLICYIRYYLRFVFRQFFITSNCNHRNCSSLVVGDLSAPILQQSPANAKPTHVGKKTSNSSTVRTIHSLNGNDFEFDEKLQIVPDCSSVGVINQIKLTRHVICSEW